MQYDMNSSHWLAVSASKEAVQTNIRWLERMITSCSNEKHSCLYNQGKAVSYCLPWESNSLENTTHPHPFPTTENCVMTNDLPNLPAATNCTVKCALLLSYLLPYVVNYLTACKGHDPYVIMGMYPYLLECHTVFVVRLRKGKVSAVERKKITTSFPTFDMSSN